MAEEAIRYVSSERHVEELDGGARVAINCVGVIADELHLGDGKSASRGVGEVDWRSNCG